MPKQQPELSNQELFANWLDENLTEQQQREFETRCVENEDFSQQVEAANHFLMQTEHYQADEVPNWNRDATFEQPDKAKWWQWQGFSTLSFATSICAIVMVLTGVQVHMNEGALTISFADKQSSVEVERLVNQKLTEFQQSQQAALATYAQAMQQQQLDASAQLTQYLITASRKERREDFAELIKHVNEQRGDDQLFYARQLNKLQQDIYAIPLQTGNGKINE